MFSFFRRRREAQAQAFIAQAIEAQLQYEHEHGERQKVRMSLVHPKDRPHRHGYDTDQRVLAVLQRATRIYHHDKKPVPINLVATIKQALSEVTDAG